MAIPIGNIEDDAASSHRRLESFDVLKAALTLLVVLHHTAITYGASGGWFYREVKVGASTQSLALTYFCAVNQAYFMGFFFLLAGYFTPAALERKGAVGFLRDRLIRLGIPLVFFGFVLGPLTAAIAQVANGADIFQTLVAEWRHATFILGPLWFAQALLLFSVAFIILHVFGYGKLGRLNPSSPQQTSGVYPSAMAMLGAAIGTGMAAFITRLYAPVGSHLWGMQLGFFPGYIVLFLVGCLAADGQLLEGIPEDRARPARIVAWLTLPLLLPLILLSRRFPVLISDAPGGWNVPSFLYAMWEPLVALGIIVALLQYSLRRFSTAPPFLRSLSRRAYCIYVIHPVILVSVSVTLRQVSLPPLVKFALVGSLACLACHVVAGLLLRLAVIRRIV